MITPGSSNEFPWISVWRLVKLHANHCVHISKTRWLRPAFAESYRLVHVTLSKELVAVHVWNAPNYWHNWLVAGVKTAPPPAKLNVKTGPLPSLYFRSYYSFGFSRLLFFGTFSSVFVFLIAFKYRIYCCFSTIFWVLACGLPSVKFPSCSYL